MLSIDEDISIKRRRFTSHLALLIEYAKKLGYEVELGEVFVSSIDSKPLPKQEKLHYLGLAAKIHLFRLDSYLSDFTHYQDLAEFWKKLHDKNTWGGNYNVTHFQHEL